MNGLINPPINQSGWCCGGLGVTEVEPHMLMDEVGVCSALSALRTPMFSTTGPQQRLQSHLHKRLEVTASLPSAVLRGETHTDTFTRNTHTHTTATALHFGF